jgi:two-component system sensor histidine kinase DesK
VTVTDDADALALTVSDDGRGAEPGQGPGNGLTGLEERLLLAGGRFEASGSGADGGFVVRASVPLVEAVTPVGG